MKEMTMKKNIENKESIANKVASATANILLGTFVGLLFITFSGIYLLLSISLDQLALAVFCVAGSGIIADIIDGLTRKEYTNGY